MLGDLGASVGESYHIQLGVKTGQKGQKTYET